MAVPGAASGAPKAATFPDKEGDGTLNAVNRKIFEIKKKIQLSEGQRKAYFEEIDAERKFNTDKIQKLKKDIKDIKERLKQSKQMDPTRIKSAKYISDVGPLINKTFEEAKEVADLKVIDLKKQLDLIRDQYRRKQEELANLAEDFQRIEILKKQKKSTLTDDGGAKKNVCSLENEIHRTSVQWMEAEHVRKKYKVIRTSLLKDSVRFESQLIKMEEAVAQQQTEIDKLQDINKEALQMRDTTKFVLNKQEQMALAAAKSRDQQILDFRQKVDERKVELERLERKIFPSGRPLVHQDSLTSPDQLQTVTEENSQAIYNNYMEETFQNLMKATGATVTEEVLTRFLSQKETFDRLIYLRKNTEDQKRHLEKKREMLMGQFEAFKFAEVRGVEVNEEELEKLSKHLEEQQQRLENSLKDYESKVEQITTIKKSVLKLCTKLSCFGQDSVPEYSEDISSVDYVMKHFERIVQSALQYLDDVFEIENVSDTLESSKVPYEIPPAKSYMALVESTIKPTVTAPSSEKPAGTDDEEEAPSRGFLKRQAQLIVDAKSRRKTFRMMLPKRK